MKTECALVLVLMASPAWAEPPEPSPEALSQPVATRSAMPDESPRLGWWLDGSLTVASAAALGLATAIPVNVGSLWNRQLLPVDDRLKGRYSPRAARNSDVLLGMDVAAPVALLGGQGFTAETGKRLYVYGETLLVSLALDATVKPWVGRPRPYTYSTDPTVLAVARSEGEDSRLSFYSRHASTAFAASVAGAYLFAQSTTDVNARATVWGTQLALASATADLRTRAGMHFYSDVLTGAVVGTALGIVIPYLHGGRKVHLSKVEWLAILVGPLAGIALGELLPATGS